MERMWYSRKYEWSPMPHALFFRGGYAIHGTYAVRQLGRPASHGCVRLAPGNARTLFEMVRARGGAQIIVSN
jgi:lipoprotein-anchoring transpeptidase ErfK/SrfK